MMRALRVCCLFALACLGLVVLANFEPPTRVEGQGDGTSTRVEALDRGSQVSSRDHSESGLNRVSADTEEGFVVSLIGVDGAGAVVPFEATVWSLDDGGVDLVSSELVAATGVLEVDLGRLSDIWVTAESASSQSAFSALIAAQELEDGRHEFVLDRGVKVSGELAPVDNLIPAGGVAGVQVFVWPLSVAYTPSAISSLDSALALVSTTTDSLGRFEFTLTANTEYCLFAIGEGLASNWGGKKLDVGDAGSARQIEVLPVQMVFGAMYSLRDENGNGIQISSDLFGGGSRVEVSEGLESESSSRLPRAFIAGLAAGVSAHNQGQNVPVIATAVSRVLAQPSATVQVELPGFHSARFDIDLHPLSSPTGEGLRRYDVELSREYEFGEVALTLTGSKNSPLAEGVQSRPGVFFVLFEHIESREIFRWDPDRVSLGTYQVRGLPVGEYLCGISTELGFGSVFGEQGPVRLLVSADATASVEVPTDALRFVEVEAPGDWSSTNGEPLYLSVRAVEGGWSKAAAFTRGPIVIVTPDDIGDVRVRLRLA